MSKFAKLFNLDNGSQVLVTTEYNTDADNEVQIQVATDISGIRAAATLKKSEDEDSEAWAAKTFEAYNQEKAIKFFEGMYNLLK